MTSNRGLRLLLVGLAPAVVIACTAAGCRPRETSATTATPVAVVDTSPQMIEDDLGNSATLSGPPQRIVSLSPAITEILFAIGAGDRVVGVTSFCDYPPEVTELPDIGTYLTPNLEAVLDLQPDLAIGMRGTTKESMTALRQAGVPTVAYDPVTVEGTLGLMERLGMLIHGEPPAAATELRARVNAVAEAAEALPRRPLVLCAVDILELYAAGPGTHIDDMIRVAGGENAAGDADIDWPKYSLERMIEKDPEVVITTSGHIEGQDGTDADLLQYLADSPAWSTTSAVRNGNVIAMNADLFTLPAPRMIDGLEQMAEAIQAAARIPAQE